MILDTRGCILGEFILKSGIQQLSCVTVASRGIALQLLSGGSEQAGAQVLPFAVCFFPVLALWLSDHGSVFSEPRAADTGWGAGGCVMLRAGSIIMLWANITLLLLTVVFLTLAEFVCIYFTLLYSSVVAPVRSFVCTLIYRYKHTLFLFQYNSRRSWGSTWPVPLLGYPAALGQGQPHICRVPGGCTARNQSLFLCQEEQEQGQRAVSPGYSVSSHRQRKLTGSSNPLCWYP